MVLATLPVIKNNIIYGNGEPFYLYGGAERAEIDITYNDIEGGWEGSENINLPPLFVDSDEWNFRLLEGSPCINAGDPNVKYNDADGTRNDIGANGGPNGYYLLTTDVTSPIYRNKDLPMDFNLYQNYPNPFNPSTKISYEIPTESKVLIKVYDILGRDVVTLINDYQKAGRYEVEWNAGNFASGVYFYSIKAGDFYSTKKLILLK